MRTREAASSARLSALAMAVATRSVKSAMRCSVSAGSGAWVVATDSAPHSRPSTTIGLAATERTCSRRSVSGSGPGASFQRSSSTRAEWPVRQTRVMAEKSSARQRVPTEGRSSPSPTTTMAVPSGSKRTTAVSSAPTSRPTSVATAEKISPGGTARATRVATRRSAACSSSSRVSSSRLRSSEPAMVLNECSSAPTSSTPVSGMRTARSPPASWPAMAAARRTGWTMALVR